MGQEDEGEGKDKSNSYLAEDFSPWEYDLERLLDDAGESKKLELFLI